MTAQNLDRKDRLSIYKLFQQIRKTCRWKSWDDFLQWALDNGWAEGLELHRKNEDKPHGPKNSYFIVPELFHKVEEVQEVQEVPEVQEAPEPSSRFCHGCDRVCPSGGVGCGQWREWYAKNWNQNIHVFSPEPEYNGRAKFRYEHPDLIREGIIYG